MNERKDFQPRFSQWIIANQPHVTTVFELKFCKGNSIRFDALKQHQKEALLEVKRTGHYHKINDMPFIKGKPQMMRFTNKKPFDCFFIRDALAFVVVWFYQPRVPKKFVMIDIEDWIKEEQISDRKSITYRRAREIGQVYELESQD